MNTSDYEIFKIASYEEKIHNGKSFLLNNAPYLDIVLHDSCNARCKFCIGDLVDERMTLDRGKAIDSIKKAKEEFGVREVLLLGGEPTLAKDLFWYISACSNIGFDKICMTTNGIRMSKVRDFAHQIIESGLTHINISYMSSDQDHQRFITGQNHYVSLKCLSHFYDHKTTYNPDMKIRINNNVFRSNNGSAQQMLTFYDQVKDSCDSVKFSPLMLTDNFSVVDEVNYFVRSEILTPEEYDAIYTQFESFFHPAPIVRNPETFGFVPYSMICVGKPIILNWNQHGQMMNKVVKENKINNIKLLSNGHLSLSWNRNDRERYLN